MKQNLGHGGSSTNDEDGSTNEDDLSTSKSQLYIGKNKKANSLAKELAGLLTNGGKNGFSPRKSRTRGARVSYNENQLYMSNVNQEKESVRDSKKSKESRKSREERVSSDVKKEARTSSKKKKKNKDKDRENEKEQKADDPVMKESEKDLVAEVRMGKSPITQNPDDIKISVQKENVEKKQEDELSETMSQELERDMAAQEKALKEQEQEQEKEQSGIAMPLDITEINLRVTDQTVQERKSNNVSSFLQDQPSTYTLENCLEEPDSAIDAPTASNENKSFEKIDFQSEKVEKQTAIEIKNVQDFENLENLKEKGAEDLGEKVKDDSQVKRKSKKRERIVESQKIDDQNQEIKKEKKSRKKRKKSEIEHPLVEIEQSAGMADFEFVKNQILGTSIADPSALDTSADRQSVTGLLDSFNNNQNVEAVLNAQENIVIDENPLTKRLKEVQKQRKSKLKDEQVEKQRKSKSKDGEVEKQLSDSSQMPREKKKKSSTSSLKKCFTPASGTPISQQKSALSKQDHLKMHGLKTQLRQQKARISSDQKSDITPVNKVEKENKEFDHQCCICFERISERAKPQNCCHSFCMECILGWTKFHNLCPLCKIEITILEKYSSVSLERPCETIEIQKPVPNELEISDSLAFDNGPQFAESCEFCKSNEREEDQIVCEHCDFIIAHYACAGFDAIPECQWYCKRCTRELKARQLEDDKKRRLFKKTGKLPSQPKKKSKKSKIIKDSPSKFADPNGEEFDHHNLFSSNKNIYGDDDSQGSEKPGDGSQDYSDDSDSSIRKKQKFVIRKSGRKTNQPRRYKSKSYIEDKEDSSSDSSQQQIQSKKQRNRNSENVCINRKRLLEESQDEFQSSDQRDSKPRTSKGRTKKPKAKVDRQTVEEESAISDDSSNLEPKESKNFTPKVQQKKKKMTKKSLDSQKPLNYNQNDILEKRQLAVDNEIMQKSTGSLLNQKLNLSMFGKFGNKLSLNPTSFRPAYPDAPFQNVPMIEPDLFDGFSARRRPDGILPGMNINPMLNKMHDQQMNLQRTPIPYNNLISTHINLENKKDNQKHTQSEEANFLRQSQNKINKIVGDTNVSQKQIDQEHVTNPLNQKVCEQQYQKQQQNQFELKPPALIPISQEKSTEPNRVSEGELHLDITNDQIRTQKKVTFCSQNESIGCSSTGVSTNSNNNINPHGSQQQNVPYFNYQVHSQDIPQSRNFAPSHLDRPKCYQSDLSSTESYKNDIYRQLDKHGQSPSKKTESHQNEVAHMQKKMDSKLQETRNRQSEAAFYSNQFVQNQNKRENKYTEKQIYQQQGQQLANSFSLTISNSPLENLHIGSSNPPLAQECGSFSNNELKRPRLEIEEDIESEQKQQQQQMLHMTKYQKYMMSQQSRMHDQNLMPHLKHQQQQLNQLQNQVVSPVYHRPMVHTPSKPHQVNAPKGLVSMARPLSNDSPQSKITEYVSPPQIDNFEQEMQIQNQVSSLARGLVPMKTSEYKPKPYMLEPTQPYDQPEYFQQNPQEYAPPQSLYYDSAPEYAQVHHKPSTGLIINMKPLPSKESPVYVEARNEYPRSGLVPLITPDVIPDQNLHIHDKYYLDDQIEETGEKRSSKRRSQTDSWSGGQVKSETQPQTVHISLIPHDYEINAQDSHAQHPLGNDQNQHKKQQNKEVREKINNFFDSCKFTKNDKASPVKHKIDGLSVAKSRGDMEFDKNGKPKDPNILYWFKTPQGKYMPVMKDKGKNTRQNQISVTQKNNKLM